MTTKIDILRGGGVTVTFNTTIETISRNVAEQILLGSKVNLQETKELSGTGPSAIWSGKIDENNSVRFLLWQLSSINGEVIDCKPTLDIRKADIASLRDYEEETDEEDLGLGHEEVFKKSKSKRRKKKRQNQESKKLEETYSKEVLEQVINFDSPTPTKHELRPEVLEPEVSEEEFKREYLAQFVLDEDEAGTKPQE